MSNNDLEFVQSAIDAQLPAGIQVTCAPDDSGGIRVTGAKAGKTHSIVVRARELNIVDSDQFVAAIGDRILALRNALNDAHIKVKRKSRKAKKKAKKRAKVETSPQKIANDALKRIADGVSIPKTPIEGEAIEQVPTVSGGE
jgi:soluble P-type ATPase